MRANPFLSEFPMGTWSEECATWPQVKVRTKSKTKNAAAFSNENLERRFCLCLSIIRPILLACIQLHPAPVDRNRHHRDHPMQSHSAKRMPVLTKIKELRIYFLRPPLHLLLKLKTNNKPISILFLFTFNTQFNISYTTSGYGKVSGILYVCAKCYFLQVSANSRHACTGQRIEYKQTFFFQRKTVFISKALGL